MRDSTFSRRGLLQMLGAAIGAAVVMPHVTSLPASLPADTGIASPATEKRPILQAPRSTVLDCFLRSHGIKSATLARESMYSREHLLHLRIGSVEPSLACIVAIVSACRRLTCELVKPERLFDQAVINQAIRQFDRAEADESLRLELVQTFGRARAKLLLGQVTMRNRSDARE